jgi:broad specificity phosphatase PhoE
LIRAHETARLVAEPRGLDVIAIRDLRERSFGSVEGMTTDEIQARYPGLELPWSDGETREAMAERVLGALHRIGDSHPGAHVLVVSHGGPLRAVLTHCGIDGVARIENCHVIRVELRNGVLCGVD